jgi:hypothetical protein
MEVKAVHLSDQAVASIMMAMQKAVAAAYQGDEEGTDLSKTLKKLKIVANENNELVVLNPPIVKFDNAADAEEVEAE